MRSGGEVAEEWWGSPGGQQGALWGEDVVLEERGSSK